ncbi:M1 family aminopeptidase [Deltaproteobacteria bacterium IMCC39524]|nr:M1 family aminopeptidase [Deltaproteobacteria bacterium IMCC39524]
MLRILLLIPFAFILLSAPVAAGADSLINQELFIRIVPEEHLLEGKAVLTLVDQRADWTAEFRLAAQADIDAVTVDDKPVPFTFANGRLQISMKNAADTLTIVYRIRFDDPVAQDHVGIEDPSLGVSATIMPQGTFLSAASAWHPLPVDANSRFRLTITGPTGLLGVTSGRLVGLETSAAGSETIWQTQRPQSALALAAGYYQVERDRLGETQLLAFFGAGNATLASDYLQSSREYLQLYQELFGPYPYDKFAVVENFYPTGYGFPGWTLLGSSVIRLPFILTTSLPHEIAHTWWGNAVEIDYSSGNWGEGLATYVADYYLKELHAPAEALEYRRKILRDYAALIDVGDDLPLSAFRSRMSKRDQAVGYGKAAMVFHMLRNLIDDEAFWAGLKAAAGDGIGKRYAWSDLQRHFEATSDMDLETFFRQWTLRTGAPQLQLTDVAVMSVDDGWQVSGTILQDAPFYDLAVPLQLETATRKYNQSIGLDERQNCFLFTITERPLSLSVDPKSDLFRKLYPEELPATVNDLRASRMPLVVVARGSEALLDSSGDLLRGLQWQQAPVMNEDDYLDQRPTNKDLLVLGWPKSPELRLNLPDGFTVAGQQVTIGDKLYSEADDVLFLVLPGHEENRVTGYFLPGSLTAARDTARRISHYGRYSTLVFHKGHNQVKTTWDPVGSPLKRLFTKDAVP